MAEEAKPKTKEVKKYTLLEGAQESTMLLSEVPDALEFSVKKPDGGAHFYSFDNATPEATKVRKQIKAIMKNVYDNGAFSLGQFAEKLRVSTEAMQALLDEEFIENNRIVI